MCFGPTQTDHEAVNESNLDMLWGQSDEAWQGCHWKHLLWLHYEFSYGVRTARGPRSFTSTGLIICLINGNCLILATIKRTKKYLFALKGTVHSKINILSLLTYCMPYDFLSSIEHKRINSEFVYIQIKPKNNLELWKPTRQRHVSQPDVSRHKHAQWLTGRECFKGVISISRISVSSNILCLLLKNNL